jgi:hypothetical protein
MNAKKLSYLRWFLREESSRIEEVGAHREPLEMWEMGVV